MSEQSLTKRFAFNLTITTVAIGTIIWTVAGSLWLLNRVEAVWGSTVPWCICGTVALMLIVWVTTVVAACAPYDAGDRGGWRR